MGLDGCLCRQVNTHAHQSGLGTGLGEAQGIEEAPRECLTQALGEASTQGLAELDPEG